MGFEGEFASYEPLRRVLDSAKVKALQERMYIKKQEGDDQSEGLLIYKKDLVESSLQPDLVLAIDGSRLPTPIQNGFPGAEIGYVTIASVLIDLKEVSKLAKDDFIDPKKFRETEKASTIESVFPGCNVTFGDESSPKESLRKSLFEELKSNSVFSDSESLLDTYEHLFRIKRRLPENNKDLPWSPIEGIEERMTYDYGEYVCPHTGKPLFSTDALRLHELMNPSGSNGELFGQIMSTLEKLWLIHILRAFENKGWLGTFRRVAFIIDGPLAVFSTSSWLTKVIEIELRRLNDLQKKINGVDLMIIGIEKSGTFFNHFLQIDTTQEGIKDKFPRQSALLLNDDYIKKNIIFSDSIKPYGQDTYFGRKFFYKTATGNKVVPVVACYDEKQLKLDTAKPEQFSRLADVLNLLDQLSSNQYPNSVSPLISAHAEAAIPLSIGKRIFEDIAREIRQRTNS